MAGIKATILICVLNSHEIVKRQLKWFEKQEFPDDVEILLVDDGSDPPITGECRNLRIHATNDFRPWTQPLARNEGAEIARGEYIICTDIDHVITRSLVELVRNTEYDVVRFRRQLGVLTEDAELTQDHEELVKYGIPRDRTKLRLSAHGNSYAIRRELFLALGGSQKRPVYPNRDEVPIKRRIKRGVMKGEITIIPSDERPMIYMIPNGRFCGERDYNPFGLFHDLKR